MKAPLPYIEGPLLPSCYSSPDIKESDLLAVEDWFFIGTELKKNKIDAEAFWSQINDPDLIHDFNDINRRRFEACCQRPDCKANWYLLASQKKKERLSLSIQHLNEMELLKKELVQSIVMGVFGMSE